MKTTVLALLLAATAPLAPIAAQAPPSHAPACDRACLEKYVDRYFDAMEAKQVSSELCAREVKFTENGVQMPLGTEGLWFRMAGKGTYKFYIPDVETQQIAFLGTLREKERQDSLAVGIVLRLKIVNERITEVEQLVIRPEGGLTSNGQQAPRPVSTAERFEKLGAPHAIFAEVIPVDKRPSREELIKTANYYFSGLQRNDGKGYYPFTDDCHRIENGNNATNIPMRNPATGQQEVMGCKRQFEVALKNTVSRVHDRR